MRLFLNDALHYEGINFNHVEENYKYIKIARGCKKRKYSNDVNIVIIS